jgi:hypothetical protein
MRRSPGRGQRERSTKGGANHRTGTPTTDPNDGSVPVRFTAAVTNQPVELDPGVRACR